jgi:uncharacterized membrane protein
MQVTIRKQLLILLALSLFAVILFCLRVAFTHTLGFYFLNWNLFLAWIPFLCSISLSLLQAKLSNKQLTRYKFVIGLLLVVWFLFLPNTFYVITDFIHLRVIASSTLWFDLLVILAYVIPATALGFAAVMHIDYLYLSKLKRVVKWSMLSVLFILNAFGIYLGRFLRWNSWDVLTNWQELFGDITDRFINPLIYPRTWVFTFTLGTMLVLSYMALANAYGKKTS